MAPHTHGQDPQAVRRALRRCWYHGRKRHLPSTPKLPLLLLALAVLALLAAACDTGSTVSTATSTSPTVTSPPATTTPASTTSTIAPPETPATTSTPLPTCDGNNGNFAAPGETIQVSGTDGIDDSLDVAHIDSIELSENESCETLRITFSSGADASEVSLPPAEVTALDDIGIVRIGFGPTVQSTSVADLEPEMDVIERVYVVRGQDGKVFMDVHLNAVAAVRASSDGQTLTVDLQPQASELPLPQAVFGPTVVTDPLAGDANYPISITGYSRNFEANVIAWLADAQGEALTETVHTTSADYIYMWGEFQLLIEQGPSGPATLMVGDFDAEDGAFEGVAIDLVLE